MLATVTVHRSVCQAFSRSYSPRHYGYAALFNNLLSASNSVCIHIKRGVRASFDSPSVQNVPIICSLMSYMMAKKAKMLLHMKHKGTAKFLNVEIHHVSTYFTTKFTLVSLISCLIWRLHVIANLKMMQEIQTSVPYWALEITNQSETHKMHICTDLQPMFWWR